ncbi:hypothetical protein RRG08_048102 [Elysia crispata]|uniref:Uncharacterized protein n=1 Tax=Elysia crispata TaxID=231223 RepID=A0AAE0Z2E9_9GAST|nr:hypothetical protein RRG08_048102 [Elysia crispata]
MEVDRVQQNCTGQVNADNLLSEDTPHLNWAEETANLEEELLLELTISDQDNQLQDKLKSQRGAGETLDLPSQHLHRG